ncbi:hypothetical protein ACIQVO_36615 [Streptomyces sp. NPDC101062]|uniref:hypothetical protein n=1 Tax=unclassified Streptomyces TaxID=2593676 RepID=UPI003827CCF8
MTVSRAVGLTAGQRAALHAAVRHRDGHLPPSVLIRDLVGLVRLGLAEPVSRQPEGAHARSPRCVITSRGRESAAHEPNSQLILVPCSSAKAELPVAQAQEM